MDTDGEKSPSPSPAPADAIKRRGRPQAGPENARQRIERLQAELKEAQAAMKQADEKRAAIVGHAALRHARRNVEFSRQLAVMLRAEIRAKTELATIGDLLDEAPPPSTSSE